MHAILALKFLVVSKDRSDENRIHGHSNLDRLFATTPTLLCDVAMPLAASGKSTCHGGRQVHRCFDMFLWCGLKRSFSIVRLLDLDSDS
jgi:hypothetical protein